MKTTIRGFIPVRVSKSMGDEFGISSEFEVRREDAKSHDTREKDDFDINNPIDRIAPCTLTIETVKNEW